MIEAIVSLNDFNENGFDGMWVLGLSKSDGSNRIVIVDRHHAGLPHGMPHP